MPKIAKFIPEARALNTWRSNEVLWKEWLQFCTEGVIDIFAASEAAFLRYLVWPFTHDKVSGSSFRNYLLAVTTPHA